jgi:hypothetical protein
MVSLATKAKIAASLRGNKNAYRGGPKKRLSHREKVANINARTKANKANLSDAQIRQRSAVAKRLRARARAEEAGISPRHSKPIPSPAAEAKSPESLEQKARLKGSVAKATVKKDVAAAPNTAPGANVRIGNGNAVYTLLRHHPDGTSEIQSKTEFNSRKARVDRVSTKRLVMAKFQPPEHQAANRTPSAKPTGADALGQQAPKARPNPMTDVARTTKLAQQYEQMHGTTALFKKWKDLLLAKNQTAETKAQAAGIKAYLDSKIKK